MENYEKFQIGTAEIDGKIEPLFRKAKKPEFIFEKHYNASEIEYLKSLIDKNMHLISRSFKRVGYFYSDKFDFCKLYIPEIICKVLTIEFNENIVFLGQGNDFIFFSEKDVEYKHAIDRFNYNFGGNL